MPRTSFIPYQQESRDVMEFFAAHLIRRSPQFESHPDIVEVTGANRDKIMAMMAQQNTKQ